MYIDRRDSLCGELRLPRPCFARARNDGILTGMSLAGLPLHNVSELKASRWGHHRFRHSCNLNSCKGLYNYVIPVPVKTGNTGIQKLKEVRMFHLLKHLSFLFCFAATSVI